MNQGEKICQSYQSNVKCFENIPAEFEFDGTTDDYCSFIFPPGHSLYVEEFILDDPGPDNFVLVDETEIRYKPKLKWQDRQQTWWRYLDKSHSLKNKSNKRRNSCIRTLKVGMGERRDEIVPRFFCPGPTCPFGRPCRTVLRKFVLVILVLQTFVPGPVQRETTSAGTDRDSCPAEQFRESQHI